MFIAPYDDPYIIAGQGSAGAEILRQLTSAQRDNLEAIFVAIGGGGLAAGIAAYTKQLLPDVKVFGVEPTGTVRTPFPRAWMSVSLRLGVGLRSTHTSCVSAGANCMAISLAHGRRVSLSKVDAFADGVAVKSVSILRSFWQNAVWRLPLPLIKRRCCFGTVR